MASLKQRDDVFYIQYYVGTVQKRISTGTSSYQLAKEKLRQFESAQLRGDDNPLPTRTPIADVVTANVAHIRTVKTAKSARTDRGAQRTPARFDRAGSCTITTHGA